MARATLFASFLITSTALAQVASVEHADPSRGLTLLGGGAALADDASAGAWNPAGLARVHGAELLYAHERSVARDTLGDGLYAAVAPFDLVSLGLSLEFVRDGNGSNPFRKTTFALALGNETLAVGAGVNGFAGGPRDGLVSFDLGVQLSPWRFLSAGIALRNVDAPERGGLRLARSIDFGLGVRPFGERLTVSADFALDDQQGLDGARLAYTARGELLRGLWLTAGFSHGVTPGAATYFQAGLQVDLGHVGAGYGFSYSARGPGHLFTGRLSTDDHRALLKRPQIAVISLDGVGESGSQGSVASLLGIPTEDRYLRLWRALEAARRDDRLAGVVLKVETAGVGMARAQELRQAVLALRAQGKVVVALLLSATDADYLYASAADKVYAVPEAMLQLDGLQASALFFGDAAAKLGVAVDVARVGAYKNSPDQFTRSSMSEEQKEALNALLDAQVKVAQEAASESRQLGAEQWQAALDQGLKSVKKCQALGLIDGVVSASQLDEQLRELVPGAQVNPQYSPFGDHSTRWASRPKIAIVPVLGTISGGSDSADPLGLMASAGAETFIRSLDAAVADPDVKAIVLRVDSPGGDGLASDLMYRAVLEARKRKPVIASMGDVAASGGYYVAMGAEQIFAQRATVTGSIGVFVIKPGLKPLAESLGVHQEVLRRAALSGSFEFFEPWSDAQRTAMQAWVEDFYDTFITEAAASRKRTKEQIDAVARGRVWSGADAQAKGLVDTLGGLTEALEAARARAELGTDAEVVIAHPSGGLLGAALGGGLLAEVLEKTAAPGTPSPAAQRLLRAVAPSLPGIDGRAQARMEDDIQIR
ncbi:MAG: signal peptide peptidase SppA [Myxococcaceae bacterium]|nr:signal peptide peptidase SppA [Myxococcaceae bacterium]